ncbi:MAG TPA: polysaccharide deacetylase family protein [Thermoanaerobaculia bacterium]
MAIVFLFAVPGYAQREVALTFDDLPATRAAELDKTRDITNRILRSLARAKAPAIGFVNESKLHVEGETDRRVALLAQWLDAGHELGNHTYSHVFIDEVSFDDYKHD